MPKRPPANVPPNARYTFGTQSVCGTRRVNQDRSAVSERDGQLLMVLADGLGGHAHGELAAETLVKSVVKSFEREKGPRIADPAAFIVLSVVRAHSLINQRARESALIEDYPRTTAVVCLVQDGYAYWGHVGDSRLYHLRDGRVVARTRDHTTSEQMREEGLVSEQTIESLDWHGQLLRCVGGPTRPTVSLAEPSPLEADDLLVLCSDGFWHAFDHEELWQRLADMAPQDGLASMMAEGLRRMAQDCDNMSAIALRWHDSAPTHPPILSGYDIDQERLWAESERRARAAMAGTGESDPSSQQTEAKRSRAIRSTIEEIESFVDAVDKQL